MKLFGCYGSNMRHLACQYPEPFHNSRSYDLSENCTLKSIDAERRDLSRNFSCQSKVWNWLMALNKTNRKCTVLTVRMNTRKTTKRNDNDEQKIVSKDVPPNCVQYNSLDAYIWLPFRVLFRCVIHQTKWRRFTKKIIMKHLTIPPMT